MLRNNKIFLSVIGALMSVNAHALTIGEVHVQSHLGQKFQATLSTNTDCMNAINEGGEHPTFRSIVNPLGKGKFEIKSIDPVMDPIVSLIIEAGCHGEPVLQREFALILEPGEEVEVATAEPQARVMSPDEVLEEDRKAAKSKKKVAKPKGLETSAGIPSTTKTEDVYKAENEALRKRLKEFEVKTASTPAEVAKPVQVTQGPVGVTPGVKPSVEVVQTVAVAPKDGVTTENPLPIAEPVVEGVAAVDHVDMPSQAKVEEVKDIGFDDAAGDFPPAEEASSPEMPKVEPKPVATPSPQTEDPSLMDQIVENMPFIGGGLLLLTAVAFFAVNRKKKKEDIFTRDAFDQSDNTETMTGYIQPVGLEGVSANESSPLVSMTSSIREVVEDIPESSLLDGSAPITDFNAADASKMFSWNSNGEDSGFNDGPAMTVMLSDDEKK